MGLQSGVFILWYENEGVYTRHEIIGSFHGKTTFDMAIKHLRSHGWAIGPKMAKTLRDGKSVTMKNRLVNLSKTVKLTVER